MVIDSFYLGQYMKKKMDKVTAVVAVANGGSAKQASGGYCSSQVRAGSVPTATLQLHCSYALVCLVPC